VNRPRLEVADIVRRHGPAYLQSRAGHVGRGERRILAALAACRTADLGGHVERCGGCGERRVAYNSCLMGRSSNGELAASMTAFSCEYPLCHSP